MIANVLGLHIGTYLVTRYVFWIVRVILKNLLELTNGVRVIVVTNC